MQYLGIEGSIKNLPALDADFIPFGVWAKAYLVKEKPPARSKSQSNAKTV